MKIVFCNYVGGPRKNTYLLLRERLKASLKLQGAKDDNLLFVEDDKRPDWPNENYAFKVHAIKDAKDKGADIVIWLDANMIALKPISEFANIVEQNKIMLPLNGFPGCFWSVGQWTDQPCLDYFGVRRDDAFKIHTVVSGFYGYDLRTEPAQFFFNQTFELCNKPEIAAGKRSTGRWVNVENKEHLGHRHDQSILSLLAYLNGVPLTEGVYADPFNALGYPMTLDKNERSLVAWWPTSVSVF